jgi:hypothetical protein
MTPLDYQSKDDRRAGRVDWRGPIRWTVFAFCAALLLLVILAG